MSSKDYKYLADRLPISVDLVKAAGNLVLLLHEVHKCPRLFDDAFVEYSIHCYETMWLPFAAKHGTKVAAPLHIEWVWLVHMLAPQNYSDDCVCAVGAVVDHVAVSPAGRRKKLKKTRGLWEKEVDGGMESWNALDTWHHQKDPNMPASKLSYDIKSAMGRQRAFNYQVLLPHYLDTTFLKAAVCNYKRLLCLENRHRTGFVVPGYDADLVWHAHMLHPIHYKKDTELCMGRILPHDDSVNDRTPGGQLDRQLKVTTGLWWTMYKEKQLVPGGLYRGNPEDLSSTRSSVSGENTACGHFSDGAIQPHASEQILDHASLSMEQIPEDEALRLPLIPENGEEKMGKPANAMQQHKTLNQELLYVPVGLGDTRKLFRRVEYTEEATQSYKDTASFRLADKQGMESLACTIEHQGSCEKSSIHILTLDNEVLATSELIKHEHLPTSKQVNGRKDIPSLDMGDDLAMLIRGKDGDWGILKGKWDTSISRHKAGSLKASFFPLAARALPGMDSSRLKVCKKELCMSIPCVEVDLRDGTIRLQTEDNSPELVALGLSIAVLHVLLQPRATGFKSSLSTLRALKEIDPESCVLLLAAGYYASATQVPSSARRFSDAGTEAVDRDVKKHKPEKHFKHRKSQKSTNYRSTRKVRSSRRSTYSSGGGWLDIGCHGGGHSCDGGGGGCGG